jgi:tetratricopeptide (TPR) repeat protein
VVGVALAFAGFYYWDRYIHLNDSTPLDQDVEALQTQVKAYPDAPEPRLALAETYLNKQRYAEAIDQASQVLQAYPQSDRALLVLGLANSFSGNLESGVTFLERFVGIHKETSTAEIDPVLELALYYLGNNYLQLERPGDAVRVLSEAVSITPSDADALNLLGLASQVLGKHEDALLYFEHAVRFVPDFSEAYAGMIDSYTALNRPDYAEYARGMQAFSQKDYPQARDLLSSAIERLPDFAPAYTGLGLTYEMLGDLPAAQTVLERAVGIEESNFIASNALLRVKIARGETP